VPRRDYRLAIEVVHEYFGISEEILWRTVEKDLPRLIPALQRMLTDD